MRVKQAKPMQCEQVQAGYSLTGRSPAGALARRKVQEERVYGVQQPRVWAWLEKASWVPPHLILHTTCVPSAPRQAGVHDG